MIFVTDFYWIQTGEDFVINQSTKFLSPLPDGINVSLPKFNKRSPAIVCDINDLISYFF